MGKLTNLSFASICCLFIFLCYSCEVVNQPKWIEQGPATITDTAVEGIKGEPSAGAINCILPHPTNKEIVYVGTVNGGIWKTENAYSPNPDWIPLTDTLPSLSITHMVFDPLDDTFNTIYAGTGNLSSGAYLGGPELGIYYTSDGGANWSIIGGDDLKGKKIYKILALPTNQNNPKLPYLFVATNRGLYRSYGLDTFYQALAGIALDLTFDDENPKNIFVAMKGDGIYHSNNNGTSVSWDSLEIDGLDFRNQSNLKLAFANKELYVAESRNGDSKVSIFNAAAPYDKFTNLNSPTTLEGAIIGIGGEQFGPFPGNQSNHHFSFLVRNEGGLPVIYLGGDRNKKLRTLFFSSTGQGKGSGRIFRGVRRGTVDWLPIVGAATHGTAPHADSRYLVFDSADNLLEADDGGIYRLMTTDKKLQWQSVNGTLRITELYSVAWDNRTQSIVAGAQDVGSLEQVASAFSDDSVKPWKAARLYSVLGQDLGDIIGANSNLESDGGVVAVSNQDSFSIRYGMGNALHTFVSRTYWNEINPNNVGANFYMFDYGCAGMFCALHPADTANTQGLHLIPYEINRADPTRFVIGARAVYEFFYDGGSMNVIDTFRLTRNATSIAYGAPRQPDILYVAKSGEISLRKSIGSTWVRRVYNDSLIAYSGFIEDIAIDPDDPDNVYFITKSKVYRFNGFSSGSAYVDELTGNLSEGVNGYNMDLKTLRVFKVNIKGEEKKVLMVGGYGGVFYNLPRDDGGGESALWLQYGEGMPNVIVTDLHYNAKDDVLVAGTWGRGAWTVANVSAALPEVVVK